ncbi:MAG: MipA/OmpV family protein [Rickettsiales bacterium]|nr:MipA/OmpV family protein [Rickettsiales bacterium]
MAFGAMVRNAAAEDFKTEAFIGGAAFFAPQFEGAKNNELYYFPLAEIKHGPLFASVLQGAGVYLPANSSRTIIFAPALRWRTKRNLGQSWGTIEYVENVRPTATLNSILKLDPIMFNFRVTDGLVHGNTGASFNFGITYAGKFDAFDLTVYSTAIYGSRRYNQTYSGITAFESSKFGYAEYSAPAGFRSVDAGAVLKIPVAEKIALLAGAEYMRLTGAAKDSPITEAADQFSVHIGAVYNF